MTRHRIATALAATLLLLGSACSSSQDDGDITAWCKAVEDMPALTALAAVAVTDGDSHNVDVDIDIDEANEMVADYEANQAAIRNDAPPSIRDDVETVLDTDPETNKVSEQDKLDDASASVNAYIRDECDLDVEL